MVQEGWGQECRCLELGVGNVVCGEPTCEHSRVLGPVPLSQAFSVPECLSPTEGSIYGWGWRSDLQISASHVPQWLAVTESGLLLPPVPAMRPDPALLASSLEAPCTEVPRSPLLASWPPAPGTPGHWPWASFRQDVASLLPDLL